jgi:hypothetical protein
MAGMQLLPLGLQIAGCAHRNKGDMRAIATRVGMPASPPEGQRLAVCVAANAQNFWGAALRAGGHELAPEQTVFANCAVATGRQPHGIVVCVSGQLTMNELQKCLTLAVGRDRCLGADNAVTQLVGDAWQGVAGGARSVLNQPAQIFGGVNSVFNNPSQLAVGPNSVSTIRDGSPVVAIRFAHKPDQIVGGPNSLFRGDNTGTRRFRFLPF